jgi:hypothetical protein
MRISLMSSTAHRASTQRKKNKNIVRVSVLREPILRARTTQK